MTPFLDACRTLLSQGFTAPIAAFLAALEVSYLAQGKPLAPKGTTGGARINAPSGGVIFVTGKGELYCFPTVEWRPGDAAAQHAAALEPRPVGFRSEGRKGGLYLQPTVLTPEGAEAWVAAMAARGLLEQGKGQGRRPTQAPPAPPEGIPQAPESIPAAPEAPAKPAKAKPAKAKGA